MATPNNTACLLNVSSQKNSGRFALIDVADAPKACRYKWYTRVGPSGHRYVVSTQKVGGKLLRLHRYLLDAPDDMHVDHINGDTMDNRRANLRIVTPQQNQANSRKSATASSRYKGVSKLWNGRWRAYINIYGAQCHLGCFESEEEAALAYDAAALRLFGEYAHLNEPPHSPPHHVSRGT